MTTFPPLRPSRRSAVEPFMAMDVLREAGVLEGQGRTIMHLEVGEPGAPPPRAVREAAAAALQGGRVGYTDALGRASLRARIARHYGETYGIDVSPARIVVTTGSSGGFILSFLGLFDAGDRIAVAAPGYPAYLNILEAFGCVPAPLETNAADRWVVTADMIEKAHREKPLKGVLLMSPANPSGVMMSDEALREICETCDRLGVAFISDEIYHGLTYERPAQTALRYSPNAIVVNSFSKYYCMTGWRIGWLVVPEQMERAFERLQQSLAISVPYLSQVAAEAAFEARDELEIVKAGYARNRALLTRALPKMGLTEFQPPDGAFYIYADVGRFTNDSLDFSRRLLEEAGVAATTGRDFDRARGHRTMRFSYAGSESDIAEAVARMEKWLAAGAQPG
ncbi:MAG: aminotransferase class I/II-fold pyridoxal phosphate-dependent enzyme [Hyphomicrobiales bacterium]|nr:aminotransferase class I/II-fold pyridoxal phosphate-dependent enzyme [Hyphomicrobiales bacterium]